MQLTGNWQQKFHFTVTDGENTVSMDSKKPHGDGQALSPKQLCLAGMIGCTALDVVSYMGKYKQPLKSLRIEADAPTRPSPPSVFTKVELTYFAEGEAETAKLLEAVEKSMTLYCGVSAMIAKNCPVTYKVHFNGSLVGEGEARFPAS